MGDRPSDNFDSTLGRLVVEQGLASEDEVRDCLSLLKEDRAADRDPENDLGDAVTGDGPSGRSLASLLVANGIVTQKQIDRLRPMIEDYRPAQQIPGFQIIKKLGAGAMAAVYLARQVSLDRLVAVKVLPLKHTSNAEFVERFYAEGRAAAKLNHPNIVQAYDVGKAGEFHYFVMEFVEGRTVFDDLDEGKRYEESRALDIIIQTARALEHAHRAGFIHRDVKPKNIMLTPDGTAKLADMGLARAVSDREAAEAESGKAYGTPYYISPEQIRGEVNVDFRADIYSLGATFYHIVTGQVPYDGPNPSAVMHKHLKGKLVPPDHLNPNLSAGIGEIIEVCMAKDRNQRYNTTTDLLHDLEAVAAGQPPMQARKKFDLSSLAALEQSAQPSVASTGAVRSGPADQPSSAAPMMEQPLFWVAVAGWAVALVMLVIAIVK